MNWSHYISCAMCGTVRKAVTAASIIFLIMSAAWGHEWYDGPCCSNHDCFSERAGKKVVGWPVRGGYALKWNGMEWTFDEKQVLRSQDGDYHICLVQYEGGDYAARPRCVYVPDAGV